ncbi:MAG: hypothetical protein RR911_07915 [Oscillospiraceae bacterium]
MITVSMLMLFTVSIIGIGFLIAVIALLVLNWGHGAAYDYTGNKMLKRNTPKKARKK